MTDTAQIPAAAAEHASAGLPQFDPSWWPGQIVWLALIFTVFYLALDKVILPKAQRAIIARRAQIAADSEAAARLAADISAAEGAANAALAEAKARGAKLAAEARDAANAEIAAAQAKADADLATKADAAEASIRDAHTKAMGHVHTIAADVASDIVMKLAGLKIAKGGAGQETMDLGV